MARWQKDDSEQDVWKDLGVEDDDYEIIDESEEDAVTKRDNFMASLQVGTIAFFSSSTFA